MSKQLLMIFEIHKLKQIFNILIHWENTNLILLFMSLLNLEINLYTILLLQTFCDLEEGVNDILRENQNKKCMYTTYDYR